MQTDRLLRSYGDFRYSNVVNNSQKSTSPLHGLIYAFNNTHMNVIHCCIVDNNENCNTLIRQSAAMDVIDCYINPMKVNENRAPNTMSMSNNTIFNYIYQLNCSVQYTEALFYQADYAYCIPCFNFAYSQ